MKTEHDTLSVYDRLNLFFEYVTKREKLMKVDEFYKRTGITNGYFRAVNKKIRDGITRKDVNIRTIQRVINVFPNANLDYFVWGKGDFYVQERTDTLEDKSEKVERDECKGRPFYDVDVLGDFENLFHEPSLAPSYYINIPEYNQADYVWIRHNGHSMHPVIQSGDKMCICEVKDVNAIMCGEIYVVVTKEMRAVRYVTLSDKQHHIRLVSENKTLRYGEYQDIPLSCVKTMYRVVGAIHSF